VDREALGILVGIDLRKPARDNVNISDDGGVSNAGIEALFADKITRLVVLVDAVGRTAVQTERKINRRAEISKARRHDADERARGPVECELRAENVRVRAELFGPAPVAHDEDRRRAGLAVVVGEPAAEKRLNAKKRKRIRCQIGALEAFSPSGRGIKDLGGGGADHVREDVVLFAVIEKFGEGERTAATHAASVSVMNLENSDSAGILVGERIKQTIVNDAEHHGG
jgi:hypothetical protein